LCNPDRAIDFRNMLPDMNNPLPAVAALLAIDCVTATFSYSTPPNFRAPGLRTPVTLGPRKSAEIRGFSRATLFGDLSLVSPAIPTGEGAQGFRALTRL
jgi:hypothetical protein